MLFDASFSDAEWPEQNWSDRLTYAQLIERLPFLSDLIPAAGLARLTALNLEIIEDLCCYRVSLVR